MRQTEQLTVLISQARREAQKAAASNSGPFEAPRARALFEKLLAGRGLSKLAIEELYLAALDGIASGRPIDLLADFADVFLGDYDTIADPLEHEDWVLIRETINEEAGNLDMDIVEYAMMLITERRVLD